MIALILYKKQIPSWVLEKENAVGTIAGQAA
jgi:hypothetical protein